MKVTIRLHEASEPMVFEGVRNTYTKGPMYCLRLGGRVTLKWPLIGILNTREEKGFTSQEKLKKKPYTIEMGPTKTEPAVTNESMPAIRRALDR